MIDTNEVLDIAREHCTEEEFEVIARAMVELDRLYELERRNTMANNPSQLKRRLQNVANTLAATTLSVDGFEMLGTVEAAVEFVERNTPLTREELEKVLKKAGFPVVASDNDEDGGMPYCWDNLKFLILLHMGQIIIRDLSKNALVLSTPLSAVTLQQLEAVLEGK